MALSNRRTLEHQTLEPWHPGTLELSAAVLALLLTAAPAFAQSAPDLSRQQRTVLTGLVAAVDAAAARPDTPEASWQMHLLRASDGSHYVAFSVAAPTIDGLTQPSVLYVRLATRRDPGVTTLAERSAVMEWLKGQRADPLLKQAKGGLALGDMPVYGAGAIATRSSQSTQQLALLELERERAREQRDEQERQRKSRLEGTQARRDNLLPFEDFDLNAAPTSTAGETRFLRSITAGPGEYDLYVGWVGTGVKALPHVVKRSLSLPAASQTELGVSSLILADDVVPRETAYSSDQQAAHPYAIGALEVTTARDNVFTNEERLALVFQIINARPAATGKPDIAVGFQLFRTTPTGEQSVGVLNSQYYSAATLPPDFDLTKGHPLFAAMAAPLNSLQRGEYRLRVAVQDRLTGRGTGADQSFRIVGTPSTLLAAAPIGLPFQRESALEPAVLQAVTALLQRPGQSASLSSAIDAARQGRFLDLVRVEGAAGEAAEEAAKTTLRAIGLYAIPDLRSAVAVLKQSAQLGAPDATVQVFFGASRALETNDRDALTAWEAAVKGGIPRPLLAPMMMDAHLRLGESARAADLARAALIETPKQAALLRGLAATLITQGKEAEAVTVIDQRLSGDASDREAQFVLLHALFSGFVHSRGPGATEAGRARFRTLAKTYVDANNRQAALVSEWLDVLSR